jgi:hypothetical protein
MTFVALLAFATLVMLGAWFTGGGLLVDVATGVDGVDVVDMAVSPC